jgi:ABC-type transporter Mla MlaB component
MAQPALSTTAPGRSRRPYRDRVPTSARPGVSIGLVGPLDENSPRLRTAVENWCEVSPIVAPAAVAHVDLAEVTHLDRPGIELLNEVHSRLTAAGWLFRITPPADAEARLAFVGAVVDGQVGWV